MYKYRVGDGKYKDIDNDIKQTGKNKFYFFLVTFTNFKKRKY